MIGFNNSNNGNKHSLICETPYLEMARESLPARLNDLGVFDHGDIIIVALDIEGNATLRDLDVIPKEDLVGNLDFDLCLHYLDLEEA